MKKLVVLALLAVAAVGCTSGFRENAAGECYTKSSVFGNNEAARPLQQQQLQYPVAQE